VLAASAAVAGAGLGFQEAFLIQPPPEGIAWAILARVAAADSRSSSAATVDVALNPQLYGTRVTCAEQGTDSFREELHLFAPVVDLATGGRSAKGRKAKAANAEECGAHFEVDRRGRGRVLKFAKQVCATRAVQAGAALSISAA
jgi:hypothetical protein